IKAGPVLESGFFNGIEEAQRANGIDLGSIFRNFKRHLHMRLYTEVVDYIRANLFDQPVEVGGIGEVSKMQEQPPAVNIRIIGQVINTSRIERATTPNHA